MNLVALRAEVRKLIGNMSLEEVSNPDLDTYVVSALDWLIAELKYSVRTDEQSLVLVAGTQEYVLPSDVQWVLWVEFNGDRLTPSSTFTWVRDSTDWRGATSGTPTEYAIEGGNLILYPRPSAAAIVTDPALSYRYFSSPSGLTPGGTPGLTDLDQRVALYEAAYEYLISHPNQDNSSRAQAYASQINRLLPTAKARANNAIEDFFPSYRPFITRRGGRR